MSWLERVRWLGPRFHRALFQLGRLQTIDWAKPWHAFRAELGLPDEGVAVIDVQPGSVAARAGLRGSTDTIELDGFELPAPGDAIVAIDGEAIDSVEDITRKVTYESAAGDELDFSIIRDGIELSLTVQLEVSATNAFASAG